MSLCVDSGFVLFPNFPLLVTIGERILSWSTAEQLYAYEIMKFSISLLG